MFVSFFPNPKPFFLSVVLWTALSVAGWYLGGSDLGAAIGLADPEGFDPALAGAGVFVSGGFLWFYLYYAICVGLFAAFWQIYAPHPWWRWSILGTALILFVTYFQVQVSVAINQWYGPFWDMVQAAVSKERVITIEDYWGQLWTFSAIAMTAVVVGVLNLFFVSHWIFRWRTAMHEFYMHHWSRLRTIEGASQRVQEDTMRFSRLVEGLGVDFVDSILTLVAFLPLLLSLSANITALPFVGEIPYPLVTAAIFWSLFGTIFLATVGIKLPGLEFLIQRTEAGLRKELVYGEDHDSRAERSVVAALFGSVRRSYYRIYFHYMYFNVARFLYRQVNVVFPLILLGPTVVAGAITLGPLNRITSAFAQVTSSFQFLVFAWPTIVELLSVYKRLRAFEATIRGEDLPDLDVEYLKRKEQGALVD